MNDIVQKVIFHVHPNKNRGSGVVAGITNIDDPFNLNRYLKEQERRYAIALAELKAGRKREHWIWYVLPQIDGLVPDPSPNTRYFSIMSVEEAKAFANHPTLGPLLLACMEPMLTHQGESAVESLGEIEATKLRSCATLFSKVWGAGSLAHRVLDRFYEGEPDNETLRILGQNNTD